MAGILTVKAELSAEDCLRIVERHKRAFTYPMHRHKTIELNFVQNGRGVRRVVRGSAEEIGDFDLAIIGENLEHVWEQGSCTSQDVRELTIHFPADLFDGSLINKRQMQPIKDLIDRSRHGLVFSITTIMEVYGILDAISKEQNGFEQFLLFMRMLNILAQAPARQLTSNPVAVQLKQPKESDTIDVITDYLRQNYNKEDVHLPVLAEKVGMSTTALSRVFKQKMGVTISTYLIDLRLKDAARSLIDTDEKIADICKTCGFNNLSNFNRTFKARKGKTPKDYRNLYKKKKITV